MAHTNPASYLETSRSNVRDYTQHERRFTSVAVCLPSDWDQDDWNTYWIGKQYVDATTDPATPDNAVTDYIAINIRADASAQRGRIFVHILWSALMSPQVAMSA